MPEPSIKPIPERAAGIRAHLARLNDYELVGWYERQQPAQVGPRNPPMMHEKMQG